jgi:hypothetical protein
MNNLSWGLYLTDLLGSIGVGSAIIATFCGIGIFALGSGYIANNDDSS